MPWTASDAESHDKQADTPALQAQWAAVANSVLKSTGNDAKAIQYANGVIGKAHAEHMQHKPGDAHPGQR